MSKAFLIALMSWVCTTICGRLWAKAVFLQALSEWRKSSGKTRMAPLWLRCMASITLKDIPMELHAQLKNEAAANFRSLTQEAMSRLERTFQIDAALTTKRDQKWIDEAIAS